MRILTTLNSLLLLALIGAALYNFLPTVLVVLAIPLMLCAAWRLITEGPSRIRHLEREGVSRKDYFLNRSKFDRAWNSYERGPGGGAE